MVAEGNEAYNRELRKRIEKHRESSTSYGQHLVKNSIFAVSQEISQAIENETIGKNSVGLKLLKLVDPDVAALVGLTYAIDNTQAMDKPLTSIAITIGTRLWQEISYAIYETRANEVDLRSSKKKVAGYKGDKAKVSAATNKWFSTYGIEKAPKEDRLHVGMKLLDIIVRATGFFYIDAVRDRGPAVKDYLRPTQGLLDFIGRCVDREEWLSPAFMPTIEPPLDWTTVDDGGYQTIRVPLVKTNNKAYLSEMRDIAHEMPTVYTALNTIQRTPWRVNKRVLAVATEAIEARMDIECLHLSKTKPMPCCPACGSAIHKNVEHKCFAKDEEAFKRWKHQAKRVHTWNNTRAAHYIRLMRTVDVARRMDAFDKFYFPHNLDFRGRVYALPMFLNPQGTTLAKGLLEFSDAMPIDNPTALRWLKIHGANSFGEDKCSFDERAAWVDANESHILGVATDPLADENRDWWGTSDKPWEFLAFCFEYADFKVHGYGFKSRLPVGLDGSCNGLQHLSIMNRDQKGAEATNCCPSDKPQDIYGKVAEVVIEKLKYDVTHGKQMYYKNGEEKSYHEKHMSLLILAKLKVTRKTTKRQVMVVPYGGTRQSCTDYTFSWLKTCLEDHPEIADAFIGHEWHAAVYLSGLVWDAIGEVVVAAREVMAFLQAIAREAAKADMPVIWRAPNGFLVRQNYMKSESKQVKTKLGDLEIRLSIRTDDDKTYDRSRQALGVSPNFVHSLDAAVLTLVAAELWERGVDSFGAVHDCYYCHAAATEEMAKAIRDCFVSMYDQVDVLEGFKAAMMPMLPEGFTIATPQRGSYDLNDLYDAEYFFS